MEGLQWNLVHQHAHGFGTQFAIGAFGKLQTTVANEVIPPDGEWQHETIITALRRHPRHQLVIVRRGNIGDTLPIFQDKCIPVDQSPNSVRHFLGDTGNNAAAETMGDQHEVF
ncbi:hypothetical protein D3C77_643800 [compost metagenome]